MFGKSQKRFKNNFCGVNGESRVAVLLQRTYDKQSAAVGGQVSSVIGGSHAQNCTPLRGVKIVKWTCRYFAGDKKFVGKLVALAEFLLLLTYKSIKSKFI